MVIAVAKLGLEGLPGNDLEFMVCENLVGVPQSITNGVEVTYGAIVAECLRVERIEDRTRSDTHSQVRKSEVTVNKLRGATEREVKQIYTFENNPDKPPSSCRFISAIGAEDYERRAYSLDLHRRHLVQAAPEHVPMSLAASSTC